MAIFLLAILASASPSRIVNGIGELGHDHIFIVAGGYIIQVGLQLRQAAMPEWVVGYADHIEGDLPAGNVIKPPAGHVIISTLGDMQHDQGRIGAVLVRPGSRISTVPPGYRNDCNLHPATASPR